jgi:Conserved protein/domain typically associated with flavoprotein oxygenases, DIM6/NTAB family
MSLENFAIEYRKTMSSFATGVTVVTTLDENEFIHGMTANSFTSVYSRSSYCLGMYRTY